MQITIQDVIDSVINGQMKQAAKQFIEGGFTFKEYDEYNISLMPGEIARLADAVMLHLNKLNAEHNLKKEFKLMDGHTHVMYGTYNECLHRLHNIQSQSSERAMNHGGFSIVPNI